MKSSSPSPEIARFIARILAHRTTPIGEIPQVVEAVQRGLEMLQAPATGSSSAAVDTLEGVTATDAAADPLVPLTAKRRRGRPRKEILPFAPVAEPARAAPVLAPRLMRRADVAAPAETAAGPGNALR